MTTRSAVAVVCAGVVGFVGGGCGSTRSGRDLEAAGVEYRLQELKEPRPNRVHVLRVDLASGKVQPAIVVAPDPDGDGPAEAALTDPLSLGGERSVLALVNTNPWDSFPDATGKRNRSWFEGQPVDIQGLAVSGGRMRSPADPGYASAWVDPRGRVSVGDGPRDKLVVEGMAGFQQVVREGAVVGPPGGALHPRTAIGVNQDGTVMWLVVVDGRQAHYSEGMNLRELGCLMLDLGCWNAVNLDGGGSSVMALARADGRLQVVNSPSDRRSGILRIRPVPVILTIRKPPA